MFSLVESTSRGKWKKVKVLVAQSCSTLCDHMDYSPPGSSVYGILQARILEWVAISFSRSIPYLLARFHSHHLLLSSMSFSQPTGTLRTFLWGWNKLQALFHNVELTFLTHPDPLKVSHRGLKDGKSWAEAEGEDSWGVQCRSLMLIYRHQWRNLSQFRSQVVQVKLQT